jgi:cobalamin biosynthesis protein CbiD
LLVDGIQKEDVEVGLPDGERVHLPVSLATLQEGRMAVVHKDAGDDPVISQGVWSRPRSPFIEGKDILLKRARVLEKHQTGIAVACRRIAINPVPREQFRRAFGK